MQGSSLTSRRDLVTGIEAIHARFSGHAYDMHTHDDEWLVGVTHAGVQDFFCRGSRRQSTRGKVILIEPGERHDGRAVEAGGFSYSMLYLPAPWVRHALGSDAGIGFRQTLAEDDRLGQAIVATCRAMLKGGGALQIEELRDRVLGRLRQHLGAAPARADRPDLGLAARAMAYLQAHFDTDLTSADLVQATGADSRFQLARAFQARYGTSPHACLVEIRLARARALLRAGQAPAEAAAACGFADQSHMTRWFRRAYGIAPGAWQRGRTIVQDHA
ncbi:AraC family transcriptional regulator [Paracoccus aminophilus]|nr:AraC family transcriptional regulator [Paracoccus aminophilus]